jgi:hypothetical protein
VESSSPLNWLCSSSILGKDFFVFACYVQDSKNGKPVLCGTTNCSGPLGKYYMHKIFDLRGFDRECLVNPGLMALQDFHIATSFFAKMSDLTVR